MNRTKRWRYQVVLWLLGHTGTGRAVLFVQWSNGLKMGRWIESTARMGDGQGG